MAVVKNSIKVYPVGNGDQTLITLSDETTILVDCNIREGCKGDDDKDMYDVHKDLLGSIKRRNKIPFVDVFILTHGDQDHCRVSVAPPSTLGGLDQLLDFIGRDVLARA